MAFWRSTLILCGFVLLSSGDLSAQFGISDKDSTDKNFSFVPVPYLSYDRTLGFSIGAVPLAMYNLNPKDTISEQSISGIVGFYTTNKTWFGMAFTKLNFGQGKWRATAAYGLGNFNYQFYLAGPIGDYINYTTGAQFLLLGIERRVFGELFLGLEYTWAILDTEFDVPIPVNSNVTLQGLGLSAAWDSRDNTYYPLSGFESKGTYRTFPAFLGNEFVSQRIELEFNNFISIRQGKDVFAQRLYGGIGIGELTFNQQFIIGNTDVRGYTQGEFRGNHMLALQAEYRYNFHERISAVGFAGVAMVFDAVNEGDNGKLKPGMGVGGRYNVFPKNHMNVGLDFAVGLRDWGIYFRIGEAF